MEYQYRLDPSTGNVSALFSFEHEVFGPWLEVEVGQDAAKLAAVLKAIDDVSSGKSKELMISGNEYSVIITNDDVSVITNISLNGCGGLPESMIEEGLELDEGYTASCGIDDFRSMLLSWTNFLTK